jgi:nicotinamidase-related amidase
LTGTRGAEFYDGIGPRDAPNEIHVTKHRYSAFWGSSIDLVLRTNGIRTLVLTGIATEVCVESTARDAFFRDYQVVVPSDCVGCYSEDRQQASLSVLARSFGIVTSSGEIASTWRKLGNGPRNWQPQGHAARNLVGLASRLDPEHTAVLVLRGRSESLAARGDAAITRLVDDARRAGCVVIHACPAGSVHETPHASELKLEIAPLGDEQIVRYHRASAFADTQLDILLRSNCIRSLVIAGSETNVEIESTVRDAADHDYYPIVIEDCVYVSEAERELHESSLATMRRHFATVVGSDEARSHWIRANSSTSGARAE